MGRQRFGSSAGGALMRVAARLRIRSKVCSEILGAQVRSVKQHQDLAKTKEPLYGPLVGLGVSR